MTDLSRIITADEIREGDRIRLTYENGAGDRDHFELTVKRVSTGGVVGASGWSHSTNQDDTITLLDRPEPKPVWEVGGLYRVSLAKPDYVPTPRHWRYLIRTEQGWGFSAGKTEHYDWEWPDSSATPVRVIDHDEIAVPKDLWGGWEVDELRRGPDQLDAADVAALLNRLADAIEGAGE